eukprot:m.154411 g.154411  ORF g.154411 m.154411 type:complete len:63 (-) comp14376_c0_seq11:190-378(-)
MSPSPYIRESAAKLRSPRAREQLTTCRNGGTSLATMAMDAAFQWLGVEFVRFDLGFDLDDVV